MNFATALAPLALIVAATPFLAISAEYTCHGDTSFQFQEGTITTPTQEAIEFLDAAMVDSFQKAYENNNDIDMVSEKFDSVSATLVVWLLDCLICPGVPHPSFSVCWSL